jgi:hypothetical protein
LRTTKFEGLFRLSEYKFIALSSRSAMFAAQNLYDRKLETLFLKSGALERHQINAHEKKLPEIRCEQCAYVTHFRNKINKHMQIAHVGIRYPCPHCDYKAGHQALKHQPIGVFWIYIKFIE